MFHVDFGIRFNRQSAWRIGCVCLLIAGIAGSGCATLQGTSSEGPVVLQDSSGTRYLFPGPGDRLSHVPYIYDLSKQVADTDEKLVAALSAIGLDPVERRRLSEEITAIRDDTLKQLKYIQDVESKTSASCSTCREDAKSATSLLDLFKEAVSHRKPGANYVKADISVLGAANPVIHFKDYQTFRTDKSDQSWMSFTAGQLLRIGTYYFRVRKPGTARQDCIEPVFVWDEPTTRAICSDRP